MENMGFIKDKYIFDFAPPMMLIGDAVENNRNKQIALFLNELGRYNVLIKDLINHPIKEIDRNIALNVAYYLMNNEDLFEIVTRKNDLPISKVSKLTRIKPENLERCRDYIITYFIILINPNYKAVQDYLRIKVKEDNKVISIPNKNKILHKGLVLKVSKRSACILTSRGEFFKIKTEDKVKVGEVCEGREKRILGNYKIHISILLVILIMIGSGIIIEYRRTQSIVVIETTSNIKIHINKLNKVIYAHSPTERGKELIGSTNILNKDLDEALFEILNYAVKNEMIDQSKKVLITISGQPIKYGALPKTSKFIDENKFISDNNIHVLINNSGNQQKLLKNLDGTEAEAKTNK